MPHFSMENALSRPARLLVLALLCIMLPLSGCAFFGGDKSDQGGQTEADSGSKEDSGSWFNIFSSDEDEEEALPPEAQLTARAIEYFQKERYQLAEEEFQKIRDRYPFSPYATVAELRLADCKYYRGIYEEAIPLYQDFEKLHPTNEAIPYVIFQIGSCYYNLMDTPDRDQTATKNMIATYERLITRYPDSPFTLEAEKRIKEGRALLAEHEWVVAQWYFRTDQLTQGVKRLENIISLYSDTPIYPSAVKELLKYEYVYEYMKRAGADQEATEPVTGEEERPWWKWMVPWDF